MTQSSGRTQTAEEIPEHKSTHIRKKAFRNKLSNRCVCELVAELHVSNTVYV